MHYTATLRQLWVNNPSARPQTGHFLTFVADLGRGSGPRGEKMVGGSQGTDSHDLATILDPFRAIFADLGPDRSALDTSPHL